MAVERGDLPPKENYRVSSIPLVALEGVGGSGKSHTGENLTLALQGQGLQVVTAKVSGLGDSERVKRLREINDYREQLLQQRKADGKILEDKKKDKIFRLATRHQIHLLLAELEDSEADLGILDRTPIMPWVYAASADPENPYLDEILKDGIAQTKSLGISTIYYLQVTPETAYSRIIARACVQENNPEQRARDLCVQIGADSDSTQQIVERALVLISTNTDLKPKEYRRWDFIPYSVMAGECQRYSEILSDLEATHGVRYVAINAENPVDQVVDSVTSDINSNIFLQNI